ncbi:hypothetical protein N7474_001824 [Penicillium riverlandense]|uniref:uncharacterized protein n=1 Tax=Penicillium riverlandense TaxID=1903569 RepID=UPI002548638D|nr:uncharacterized protein N7474_001824 [Penicillium riverlandense]KAJ5833513.1 hypothetical protein N7474_001824 [Penicillium riverlandense]
MPVTITTTSLPPRRWEKRKIETAEDLFKESCQRENRRSRGVLQSSFSPSLFNRCHVSASQHGFVWAVIHAYSYHHNLTIRPEDVWFSILTQLSFFVNAHAEALRSFFVAHKGQKELEVTGAGNIKSADFGALAVEMTRLIEKNVVDPELRNWIMPEFSTTTEVDSVVAAVLMMGAMQKYFSFTMSLMCGIPSVTLLGEREDWAYMVKKLDKLHQLGDQPARFSQLLRPILNHFVLSFDRPESPQVKDFWSKCAHKLRGSGTCTISGWITTFCFWDVEGQLLSWAHPVHHVSSPEFEAQNTDFGLDDVLSRGVDTDVIPSGYASVPITVNDNGVTHKTTMLAGLVGIQATSSGAMLDGTPHYGGFQMYQWTSNVTVEPIISSPNPATEEPGLDSIQPLSGWWMYENETNEDAEKRAVHIQKLKDEIAKSEDSDNGVDSELYRKYHHLLAF